MALLTPQTFDLLNSPLMRNASKADIIQAIMEDANVKEATEFDDTEDTMEALTKDAQIRSILEARGLIDVVRPDSSEQAKSVASRLLS